MIAGIVCAFAVAMLVIGMHTLGRSTSDALALLVSILVFVAFYAAALVLIPPILRLW